MSKVSDRVLNAGSKKAPKRKGTARRRGARKMTDEEIQGALSRYHAVIERIGKIGIPSFSAAKEQRESRRRELGE